MRSRGDVGVTLQVSSPPCGGSPSYVWMVGLAASARHSHHPHITDDEVPEALRSQGQTEELHVGNKWGTRDDKWCFYNGSNVCNGVRVPFIIPCVLRVLRVPPHAQ